MAGDDIRPYPPVDLRLGRSPSLVALVRRKATVTLARKLAVLLHRMLRDRSDFVPHKAAPVAA